MNMVSMAVIYVLVNTRYYHRNHLYNVQPNPARYGHHMVFVMLDALRTIAQSGLPLAGSGMSTMASRQAMVVISPAMTLKATS